LHIGEAKLKEENDDEILDQDAIFDFD